jgi:hypothetical protein
MFGSLLRAGNVRCSEHFPHWQPEMYFAPGTRPGAKCFLLVGITVCGEKQKPRDNPRFCNKKKERKMKKMKDDLSLLYRPFVKKKSG